ncbi:hypothetical protein ACFWUW_14175 [Streptomyces sp. NPDC058655]|uniref:hypothetical protein n=1 Tax=unclassified Streptomyces TaxID=2593676 RepID=UPI00365540AE
MVVTHAVDSGVLTIRLHEDLDVSSRGSALREIEELLRGYRPRQVVVEMAGLPVGPVSLSIVLRVERWCRELGASLDLVASAPEARRQLLSHSRLPVWGTVSEAMRGGAGHPGEMAA